MLIKPFLVVGMLAGGGSLISAAFGAFSPPLSPRGSVVVEEAPAPMPVARAQVVPEPPAWPARLARPAKPARAAPLKRAVSAPAEVLRPCGEWRDIGAVFEARSGATGLHRVRSLCE